MYTPIFVKRIPHHAMPHYAPFSAPWGIYITTQSTDNQHNYATNAPNTLQKNTTHKWGIAPQTHAPHPFYPSISHYAPHTTLWGMHNTIQHNDNQTHNFNNTTNALQKTHHTNGALPKTLLNLRAFPAPLFFPLSISHHTLFTTPWGIYTSIQSTDNQTHNFNNTPNTLQKTQHTFGALPRTTTHWLWMKHTHCAIRNSESSAKHHRRHICFLHPM